MNKTRKIEISVEIIRILSAIAISYGIALLTLIVISSDPLFIVKQFVLDRSPPSEESGVLSAWQYRLPLPVYVFASCTR